MEKAREQLSEMVAQLSTAPIPVLLGGHRAKDIAVPGVEVGDDMGRLASFARELRDKARPR